MNQKYSVLLVTADHARANDLIGRLRTHFEKLPFEVELAEDGSRALYLLNKKSFFLVIADADLPIMDGLSLVREIRRDDGGLSVFILANKQIQVDEPGIEMMALPIQNWTDFLNRVEWQLPEVARVRYGLKKQDKELAKLIEDYVSSQMLPQMSANLWGAEQPIFLGATHTQRPATQTGHEKISIVVESVDTATVPLEKELRTRREFYSILAITILSIGTYLGASAFGESAFAQSGKYLALFLGGFSLFGFFMARVFERVSNTLIKSRIK